MNLIEEKFSLLLKDVIYPTYEEKEKEHWNISGVLKNNSNQNFKFDVRPMFNMPNNQLGKKGTTASKADKIVFEADNTWIIVDILELHEYIKNQQSKVIQLEDLLNKLEWNLYISKV